MHLQHTCLSRQPSTAALKRKPTQSKKQGRHCKDAHILCSVHISSQSFKNPPVFKCHRKYLSLFLLNKSSLTLSKDQLHFNHLPLPTQGKQPVWSTCDSPKSLPIIIQTASYANAGGSATVHRLFPLSISRRKWLQAKSKFVFPSFLYCVSHRSQLFKKQDSMYYVVYLFLNTKKISKSMPYINI